MKYVFGFPKLGTAVYAKGVMYDVDVIKPFLSKDEAARCSKKILPESRPRVFKLVPVKLRPGPKTKLDL